MRRLCQSFDHDADHGELDEAGGDHGERFVVSRQATVAAQPRERALNHPASADDLEATILVSALHDLEVDRQMRDRRRDPRASVAAIGEDLLESRVFLDRLRHDDGSTVTVLRARRDHLDGDQMAFRVDDGVALNAFRFLARVISDRIARYPPFSVAFATWVSMIAAVGSALRPQAVLHCANNAS